MAERDLSIDLPPSRRAFPREALRARAVEGAGVSPPRCGFAVALALLLAAAPALSAAQTGRETGVEDPAARTAPLPRPAGLSEPEGADPEAAADLFARPEIAAETRRALALYEAGDGAAAAALLDRLAARHPRIGEIPARRAALALAAGDPALGKVELERAAGAGFDLSEALADPLFAPLADDPDLAALAARPPAPPSPEPVPAPILGGEARVSAANTAWDPEAERLRPRFAPPGRTAGPVLPPGPKAAARDLLVEHVRRGRAAGNAGDLYDNRDRGHSRLPAKDFPQVAAVTYSPAARAADLDYGLNDQILFDRPTFGNSSTAITAGPWWRSLPRQALTEADGTGPMRLWQTAAANQVYVYPAHKDYGTEAGDLFPANTPYLIVSRGSSGSDQPFLEAVAMILASLRPDTKAKAAEAGMINSTVQMVFRRSLQNVRSRESYFSSDAHPAAFEAFNVNLARMVSLANSLKASELPAEARIRVVEEELGTEGVDFFGEGLSERLFDTPQAVARVWRSSTGRRTMILSAEDSRDANGRPLTFQWRLLQGDPRRVKIEPLEGGRQARVTLDWHEPFAISEENAQKTSRVDIGVFAVNGVHDSAPAILSWAFPTHETRVYETGEGGAPRIVSIDHADPARAKAYADPLLYPRADWRDVYRYDASGRPLGWTRSRGGTQAVYGPDGTRAETGATGAVRYPLDWGADGITRVVEVPQSDG